MTAPDIALGVDFGTSNTVAMLVKPGRAGQPLLFDGSPMLPSAVFAQNDRYLTGQDALRAASSDPSSCEPNPKRCIADGSILLGDSERPVEEVVAAVLRRVAHEAERVAGAPTSRAVLTHPADWPSARKQTLTRAARLAGLPEPATVDEPVAAAAHFLRHLGHHVGQGRHALIYDLGAGTCDVTVVRHAAGTMQVVETAGLPDLGGLDVDAAVVKHFKQTYPSDQWERLESPETPADRRNRRMLWTDVRGAKELLSRETTAALFIPVLDVDAHLTRDEVNELAAPLLAQTVELTEKVVDAASLSYSDVDEIFLVGGGSRIPLVATMLLRATGIAPTAIEQPETVVASGSVDTLPPAPVSVSPPQALSPPQVSPPTVPPHVSSPPVSPQTIPPQVSSPPVSAPTGPISTPPRAPVAPPPPRAPLPA
ncbi:MAG: Hsp70 family protein, partial [Stackebrandtia sp.]